MVPARRAAHDVGVPRLLVMWSRPHHLTPEEAERWARAEVRVLLADSGIRSASLTRLASASVRHGGDRDWLLELDVAAPDCLERGPGAEWLGDLRLLGMKPVVMLVAGSVDLEAGGQA
jgi:hypothetical protein